MSEPLSYLSTLEEVISTSDDDLRQGFGYLAPETVKNYVMHLRNKLRTVEKGKEVAEAEVVRLKKVISEKDESLAGFISALGVGDIPNTAPPMYDISLPGPSSTSVVPNLTYTGYSQELDVSSTSTGIPPANLSPNSPKIEQIHQAKLQKGFAIKATFVYKRGTEKFTINLLKENQKFNVFHLDFRPYPHGGVIVMNTNPGQKWEQEIRSELPQLMDGKMFNVTVHCEQNQFKVQVDDEYIEKSFPYRYPLEDVSVIKLVHGSQGNKWIALSWGLSEKPFDLTDTKKDDSQLTQVPPISQVENLGDTTLRPGMNIEAKVVFKKGTAKFNINLMKMDGFYIFHLDFRPDGNVIVMNTNPNRGWETEVRAELPQLSDGQLLNVGIECGEREFKVKVNDNYIEKTFPYRYPLKDVKKIKVNHGSNGNKWIALSWGPSPDLADTKNLGSSNSAPGQSSSDNSAFTQLPPISEVENLGDTTFKPGMNIEAKVLFKKGTAKFTINLMKMDGFYIFHLDFRPYPHGSVIVMNTNPNRGWETEVRAGLPQLSDGQLVNVVIECGEREFKVKMNDNYIEKTFPYRYPLKDVKKIKVNHGSNGNKWVSLNISQQLKLS